MKNGNRKGVRQGDVLLRPTDRVRGEPMRPVGGRLVLAEGEHTGHSHSFAAAPSISVLLDADGNGMFVRGTSDLEHQEHGTLSIDGDYEVIEQRRVGPFGHRVLRSPD